MTNITTYSGKIVDIENPMPESIDIGDIAHALSFLCRGGGNTNIFFPVARHCVYCAMEAEARGYSDEVVFACLLHDASEAYMVDIPKPIKDNLIPQYRVYENKVLDCVYRKYIGRALNDEEKALVDRVDHDLLNYDLMYLLNMEVELPEINIEMKYVFEDFKVSEKAYLEIFEKYTSRMENQMTTM